MTSWAPAIMLPQEGVGGWMPWPRNETYASSRMALATSSVAATMIGAVVFGTPEPKAGALVSAQRAHEAPGLNHRLTVRGGVCEEEARALIQAFFRDRRGASTL